MPTARLCYDTLTHGFRSQESPFRFHISLYCYVRCSFRKLYMKQGMHSLLRCSSHQTYHLFPDY